LDSIGFRHELDPNPNYKAGIFNAITVTRTRPLGVFLYEKALRQGQSPNDELKNLVDHFKLAKNNKLHSHIYGARSERGPVSKIQLCYHVVWLLFTLI